MAWRHHVIACLITPLETPQSKFFLVSDLIAFRIDFELFFLLTYLLSRFRFRSGSNLISHVIAPNPDLKTLHFHLEMVFFFFFLVVVNLDVFSPHPIDK